MRFLEALGGGAVTALVLVLLAHHLNLHIDLMTVAGVGFLLAFVAVLVQPRDRIRR
jgi:hypothetical protein